MRRSAALYGILGLVLLAFGLVDYFISSGFRLFVWVNLVGGIFSIVLWITSSRSELSSITTGRSARYGANAVIYSIAFIGLLVAINYISTLHHTRLDLTSREGLQPFEPVDKHGQGSEEAAQVLRLLPGRRKSGCARALRDLRVLLAQADLRAGRSRQASGARRAFQSVGDGHHASAVWRRDNGEGTNVTDLTEESLTNAIIRATRSTKKVIEFLDGHGEADPDDAESQTGYGTIKKDLEGEGYEVRKLELAQLPKVPDDANLVVVAGPIKPLGQHEIDALNDYLKHGGRMIAMYRPQRPDNPIDEDAMVKLAGEWGVKVGNDIVVDQVVRLFEGPALGLNPIVQNYGEHPITKDFKQRTVFPMARSLTAEPNLKPGLTVTPMAKTSDTSWAEVDLDTLFRQQKAELTAKDTRGPIAVAMAVDGNLEQLGGGKGDARIVVYGSTEFADNQNVTHVFQPRLFHQQRRLADRRGKLDLDSAALDSRVALPPDRRAVLDRVRICGAAAARDAADCRDRRVVGTAQLRRHREAT